MNAILCQEQIRPLHRQLEPEFSPSQTLTWDSGKSGKIPLSKDSTLLTTFITPLGHYHFNRLPFGITSAPEHFQRRMSVLLKDLEGVICLIDDILIYGKTQEEHDERLLAVLNRLEEAGLTLNREKCEFSRREVKFLGHPFPGQSVLRPKQSSSNCEHGLTNDCERIKMFSGNGKSAE